MRNLMLKRWLIGVLLVGMSALAAEDDGQDSAPIEPNCAGNLVSISSHPRFQGRTVPSEAKLAPPADGFGNVDTKLLKRFENMQAIEQERQLEERTQAFIKHLEQTASIPFYLTAEVGRHYRKLKRFERYLGANMKIRAMLDVIKYYPKYATQNSGYNPQEIQNGIDAFIASAGKIIKSPFFTRDLALLIRQIGSVELKLRLLGQAVQYSSSVRQSRDLYILFSDVWTRAALLEMDSEMLEDLLMAVTLSAARNEAEAAGQTDLNIADLLVETLKSVNSVGPLSNFRTGGFDPNYVLATLTPLIVEYKSDARIALALRDIFSRAPEQSELRVRAARLLMRIQ